MRRLGAAVLCLALASCQPKKSASLHVDPTLESLAPADTILVAGARLDAIRQTPVYQKLLGRLPLPQLEEFTRQTGLDPRKDFSEILFCSNGKGGLLLARGNFAVQDLEKRMESKGAARFSYKKYRIFGNEQAAVFFLNGSTAVTGPARQLRSLIDQAGKTSGLPAPLRDLLRALPADDQVYAALIGGLEGLNLPIPQSSNLANIAQVLQSVDSAALGMNLSDGIHAVAHIHAKTERDAKFVHDVLRGLVGFGRLNAPDNQPDLLKLYDAIQVTQQETQVAVTANLPPDLVERFLNLRANAH